MLLGVLALMLAGAGWMHFEADVYDLYLATWHWD
jgi:hypothetical protein